MSGYIGPIPVPQGIQNKETFTATAAQTTFNTNGYTDGAFINVFLNGVRLVNGTDYTATNGSDVVLASGANAGDVLDFETFNEFSLASQQFENITTKNPTHEDTDGGRESALSFQGEQSGGEISTLAAIQASHDGTGDDQKGDLIFKTNDGSDNNAPTERLRIDSAGSIVPATLGSDNVHLGEGALVNIASGAGQNTGIGANAGTSITTGDYNALLGYNAGDALTTGNSNVAIGYNALSAEDGHGSNIAIGANALGNQNAGADAYNVAVGHDAGTNITTGVQNTILGGSAADALTTGNYNVALGLGALGSDTQGSRNTAVGYAALYAANKTSATNSYNTAIGFEAGAAITTGVENTIVGALAGDALTTGEITAFGFRAGSSATTSVGNTLIGSLVGDQLTTGGNNTAMGSQALANATTTTDNTAIGHDALRYLTTGTENTAIGSEALDACTVGNGNVAVGVQALSGDINGSRSTAVGTTALKVQEASGSSSNNYYNVAVGYDAGGNVTTGYYNTLLGVSAGQNLTTGTQNVFVGMDATTASGSDGNQITIGYDVDSIGGNYTTLGNNSIGRVYNQFSSNASWTRTSDERIKKDIQTNTDLGLDFVNDLRTVTYKWKAPSEHPEEFKSYNADQTEAAYTEKMYGFIAQEVKAAMDTHNITGFNGWHVTSESQGSQQGISYEMFVMPLVKAVQELSAKVTTLETENTAIKARLDALEAE